VARNRVFQGLSRITGWIRSRQSDFWTASASVVIAVFTIVLALVGWINISVMRGQLSVMQSQLGEMHSGGQDTHDLAIAAQNQAKNIGDIYAAADKIRSAAEQVEHDEGLLALNARESLDAAITNAHNSDRAWVTPTNFRLSVSPGPNKQYRTEVYIANTGRTPAIDLSGQFQLVFGPLGGITLHDIVENNANSKSVLAPGPATTSFYSDSLTLNDMQGRTYDVGMGQLFVIGIIWYKDVFRHPHWTKVCAWHNAGMTDDQFEYYWLGNDVDQEPGLPPR
jgi:hypothetical protein